jgi:hypothetical protein
MACVFACSDVAETDSGVNTIWTTNISDETECVDAHDNLDNCPFTATPAIVQERATFPVFALINKQAAFIPFKNSAFVPSYVIKSDINQNSPPKTTFLIFIRLRNFRI